MLQINKLIEKEMRKKLTRNWDHIYFLIDVHDTIIESDYKSEGRTYKYYDGALETLRILSSRPDIKMILWSSCNNEVAKEYLEEFESQGIEFLAFNRNPLEESTEYACFLDKPYFNVILDDKAGFEPSDWLVIQKYLEANPYIGESIHDVEFPLINNNMKVYQFTEDNDQEGEIFHTLLKLSEQDFKLIESFTKEDYNQGTFEIVPATDMTLQMFKGIVKCDRNDYADLIICGELNSDIPELEDYWDFHDTFYKRNVFNVIEPEEFFK